MNTRELPTHCVEDITRIADPCLFKTLSDPTRLAVLIRLATASSPLTVSDASQCCGVHLSGVSRHLKTLREAGLVEAVKSGREVVYRPRLAELVATLRGVADALESGSCCGDSCGCSKEADALRGCRSKGDSNEHGSCSKGPDDEN